MDDKIILHGYSFKSISNGGNPSKTIVLVPKDTSLNTILIKHRILYSDTNTSDLESLTLIKSFKNLRLYERQMSFKKESFARIVELVNRLV